MVSPLTCASPIFMHTTHRLSSPRPCLAMAFPDIKQVKHLNKPAIYEKMTLVFVASVILQYLATKLINLVF